MIPLFEAYPRMAERVPHAALGRWPTPVIAAPALAQAIGGGPLYIKRDDCSGEPYGGNKVRKLEFLLGRAVHDGARAVLTFGAAGSNHALATALYARQLGLHPIAMLVPQPNAHSVRRNLLCQLAAGAELHAFDSGARVALGVMQTLFAHARRDGRFPQVIPPGGTSPVGIVGFVNAAFELRAQIDAGLLPAPARLYCASGTMGTVVGLALGLRAAGLDTVVEAVRVTWEKYTSRAKAERLFHTTNHLLHEADPAFPRFDFDAARFVLRDEFFGPDYGLYTGEGMEAVRLARAHAGLGLEGTYTGKTMAALVADARAGALAAGPTLFWDTYNGADLSALAAGRDYRALPPALHRYFEEPVQPMEAQETGGDAARSAP